MAIARGANAHHRNDARRGKLRRVALQGLVRKTIEHKRSVDGLQVVAVVRDWEGCVFAGARGLGGSALIRRIGGRTIDRFRRQRRTTIERIDLQHLLDRRDTRDRFLRELTDAEGKRARQLAVEIDRAPAHAGNHAGIFGLGAVQTHQDNVALGTVHVVHDAQNFHVHGLGLHTLKHRERGAFHAFVDLIERHDGRRGADLCRNFLRISPNRERQKDGE